MHHQAIVWLRLVIVEEKKSVDWELTTLAGFIPSDFVHISDSHLIPLLIQDHTKHPDTKNRFGSKYSLDFYDCTSLSY